jgi:type IV pilus assembly protein PilA
MPSVSLKEFVMLARIRKSGDTRDQGFTLIELLVVMIIIGILAAIAIPVFLNQRKKAVDASTKSDLRTVAVEMETYFAQNQNFTFTSGSVVGNRTVTIAVGQTLQASEGNVITAKPLASAILAQAAWGGAPGYCLTGVNAGGTNPATGFTYNSLKGGLSTTACP